MKGYDQVVSNIVILIRTEYGLYGLTQFSYE